MTFLIILLNMTILTQLYKHNSYILQKYISISRGQMQHNNYHNLIEIFDSEEQHEFLNERQRPLATSELKYKASNLMKEKKYKGKSYSNPSLQKVASNKIQYEDIYSFRDIQITSNLKQHLDKFTDFIQYSQKNVLFIFGPSGCGKTLLTLSSLKSNGLSYQLVKEKQEQNDFGQNIYEDSVDMMYRILSTQDKIREKIYILKDFPISVDEMSFNFIQKYKIFKENIHHLISNINNRNKYIFILNSEIYSSYYLLSEASQAKAINLLPNVSVVKMEPYPPREIKKIISRFIQNYPAYANITNHQQSLEEIVTEANGDARKALSLIYTKKIRQLGRYNSKAYNKQQSIQFCLDPKDQHSNSKYSERNLTSSMLKQPQQQKQQQKVTIFHALGKLLYGKRYNIYYNPHDKKNKKTNKISCLYTQQQIDKLNPKFYFKPVQLIQKSHLNINICTDLLQQNFLNQYGKIKDICKMYHIFRYMDSYLVDSLNKFQLKQHMELHLKQLLTWGIIVYNKNSIKQTSLLSIQRSKNNIYQKIITKKNQLIKTYYLIQRTPITITKHNQKDIVEYAYYLKATNRGPSLGIFQQKLMEIIFDNGKRSNSIMGSTIQRQINIIQDEQQQVASQNCNKLNKITDTLAGELAKKNRIIEMMIEDSDQSDIDSN